MDQVITLTLNDSKKNITVPYSALIVDIDPDKIADLDDIPISDIDIGRDELFNSTN